MDLIVKAVVIAASTLLCACTPSLEVRERSGGLAVPSAYVSSPSAAETPKDIAAIGWLKAFGDERLNALANLALSRNPDLLITAARVSQARAQAKVAHGARFPTLDAQFASNRFQNRFTGPDGQVGVVRQNQFNLSGVLQWELDVWGRLASASAAARRDYLANEADLAAAQLSLMANVARAYFDLSAAAMQADLAKQTVENFSRSLSIVSKRAERGITNVLDVSLTANALQSAQAQYVARRARLVEARRALEVLLADYPAGEIDAAAQLPQLDEHLGAGVPSTLLTRRPDVAAAYLRLEAADYRVAEARRALLPALTLTASAGNRNESFAEFMDFDNLVWQLASNIAQPLYRGGRLRANVRLVSAQADEALASYAQTVLTAFEEVENALTNDVLLAEQVAFQSAAAKQAESASALSLRQYGRGLTPILNLLESQRSELDSRAQLIDASLQRVQNRITLYLALGGPPV